MARTPAAAVARDDCRLRVVARHGVGYDSVDVPAMTRAGVLVTNTPTAMPRPVATTALTFILALAGKLLIKDRLTRDGPLERADGQHGHGAHRAHARRRRRRPHRQGDPAHGADVRPQAPRRRSVTSTRSSSATSARARSTSTRCSPKSDFVVAITLLNAATRHLIGAPQFARMKPTAYFINVSRGPVVDEAGADRGAARAAHRRRRRSTCSSRSRSTRPTRCWRWTT